MDLELTKYHMQELYNLLIQEPNNPLTARVAIELETLLNSHTFKYVEPKPPINNK